MACDTTMGGPGRDFPTTAWSELVSLADPSGPEFRERMDRFLRAYWKPVFAYIRTAWRKSNEDAKDLTQEFFTLILEKRQFSRLPACLGSFRAYLRVALKHFLANRRRSDEVRRAKQLALSMELTEAESRKIEQAVASKSPEQAYDHLWLDCVLGATVETLRERLERDGKTAYFEVFRVYCLGGRFTPMMLAEEEAAGAPTYEELAARMGLKVTDVRNYLSYCRRAAGEILEEKVRETVRSEQDLQDELREILGP